MIIQSVDYSLRNETMMDNLVEIVEQCVDLASHGSLEDLNLTATADQFNHRENLVHNIQKWIVFWIYQSPTRVQSGKQMIEALLSEGFEDTLEQMEQNIKDDYYGHRLVEECQSITQLLGTKVTFTED
ncbi:hypothetical protein BLNAU_4997 [Blattamonas nauphoetae]|uniref:Uncharacterized protein n=1 Tax=Blattamonas nauphoetae TaxID=2049346 RepID=A0ABQ9Y8T3_9EUKA|nr:hypothetical protein BLNAU_4997 [Blattamonas nauphoetae]